MKKIELEVYDFNELPIETIKQLFKDNKEQYLAPVLRAVTVKILNNLKYILEPDTKLTASELGHIRQYINGIDPLWDEMLELFSSHFLDLEYRDTEYSIQDYVYCVDSVFTDESNVYTKCNMMYDNLTDYYQRTFGTAINAINKYHIERSEVLTVSGQVLR